MTTSDLIDVIMARLPKANEHYEFFARLTDEEIVDFAFLYGHRAFGHLSGADMLNRTIMHSRLALRRNGQPPAILGDQWFGDGLTKDFDTFSQCKLITCLETGKDSEFTEPHDLELLNTPEKLEARGGRPALDWSGGVCRNFLIRDPHNNIVERLEVVAASSGVQGAFDKLVSSAIADMYGALYVVRAKARYALAG